MAVSVITVAMVVAVTQSEEIKVSESVGKLGSEHLAEGEHRTPADAQAAQQQYRRHPQTAQTLNLAETGGVTLRGRPQSPLDRNKRHDVRYHVRERVESVANEHCGVQVSLQITTPCWLPTIRRAGV